MTDDQPIPPTPQSEGDADNDAAHPKRNAVPEVKIPPSHASYKITCDKKRDKWDVAKLVAEFIGLAFLILYTLYTAGIYCANQRAAQAALDTLGEIQKQTKIQRQQVVGTQGAVIEVSRPVWNPTTQSLSITLANANQGAVTGTVTSFKASLQRETWPGEKPIGEPLPIELISPITLMKGGQFAVEKSPPWPLPPKLKDQRFWPGKEVVILKGSYAYANGFEDSFSGNFCYLWLPPWDLTMPIPTQGGWSGGQWSGGKQGCPAVQEKINEFVGYEKHIVEVTTPHHP